MNAQVIVLNGGSSSGKSTIARALQELLPEAWLSLSVDTLVDAMPARLTAGGDGIGFADDGVVDVGPDFMALQDAWITGLVAMARAGAHLVVDDVFLGGGASQHRWLAALGDVPTVWVGVRCDPAVAARREAARGDRVAGMAAQQADVVHRGVAYDLEVDTSRAEAADCARAIAAHLRSSRGDRAD
ncbi:chloramphenicol phosphotransferase CPT [Promicromonospora thailandica]|uniref:Chloramphenicol 3-O phosphotransferase n=1 Tax=Promicromonospora thailandica TaxID=765201 RepID=A0A9X2JUT7_9MICO|nr:chloramphenicol phosphotransferase CPT [Promicromonospora thailandica]MCP2263388.1 chloramphenicol 3-O phosphotransferase [Promicromonospora thailandica]BFF19451.1 chloramphenicol phosphotransferase CPT family protein [Promicromonospora thailandica]